jgi:DNA-binding GntR family transcriptional regulator
LDRNEIAGQLGLSRVPVQEAVVELEHIGVVSTRYHRGAFVERFDADVVREHHEIYGVLNGIATARAAADHRPKIVDQLRVTLDAMRTSMESRNFHEHTWRYRQTINDQYAGPRLKAAIRASQTFMPRASGPLTWAATTNFFRSTSPRPPPSVTGPPTRPGLPASAEPR